MGQVLCGYIDNEGHNYEHESFGDERMSKLLPTSPNFKANKSNSRNSSFSRPRKATKLSELNPRERARAAIIGGFVADAATMPLHLIYDQMGLDMLLDGGSINHGNHLTGGDCSASVAGSLSTNSTRSKASSRVSRSSTTTTAIADNDHRPETTVRSETGSNSSSGAVPTAENRCSSPTSTSVSSPPSVSRQRRVEPEFFAQPSSPFYSYAVGRQSPYGDEAHTFLRMISTRGYFDADECCEEAFRFLRAYMERGGGRTNAVLRTFVERRESGLEWAQCSHASDAQFFCITKVPILVARYAGSPHMLARVEEGVRMFQTNEEVLSACRLTARLLERVIMGHSVLDTLRWAASSSTNSSSSSNSSSSNPSTSASTDPATSATGPVPDLSDGERAFLRVLEGMDGFMGLTGTRARATASATAPSSSTNSHTAAGAGGTSTHCTNADGNECGSEEDEEEEETEAVHAIITNGDFNLIFATAHPSAAAAAAAGPEAALTATEVVPAAPTDAGTAATNGETTIEATIATAAATNNEAIAAADACCNSDEGVDEQSQSQSQSQSAPISSSSSSSSSSVSSPSKLSRLRMAAAMAAGTSASSCGDDGGDNDNVNANDNDLDKARKRRLPVIPAIPDTVPSITIPAAPDNDPVVATATDAAASNSSSSSSNCGRGSSSNSGRSSSGKGSKGQTSMASSKSNSSSSENGSSGGSSGGGAPSVPFSVAAEVLGLGPRLPGSLQASLVALVCFPTYKAAVRANIVAGGDNALRAWFIGSLLAAEQGVEAIPSEWIERTLLYPQIEIMATRLAGSNPYFETLHEKGCRIGVLLA